VLQLGQTSDCLEHLGTVEAFYEKIHFLRRVPLIEQITGCDAELVDTVVPQSLGHFFSDDADTPAPVDHITSSFNIVLTPTVGRVAQTIYPPLYDVLAFSTDAPHFAIPCHQNDPIHSGNPENVIWGAKYSEDVYSSVIVNGVVYSVSDTFTFISRSDRYYR
jgi:hypothetical protein